jgi:hypothetical protein
MAANDGIERRCLPRVSPTSKPKSSERSRSTRRTCGSAAPPPRPRGYLLRRAARARVRDHVGVRGAADQPAAVEKVLRVVVWVALLHLRGGP